jgi:hypothetical protein
MRNQADVPPREREPKGNAFECGVRMAAYKLPYKPIHGVHFQPWIGENYEKRRPRLLVIGMSHYDWDDRKCPEYFATNDVIQSRASGECRGAFFTNIVAICIGRLPNDEEREQFWQSVAFYNYIQEFVGDSPQRKHDPILWERGEPAFFAVLRRLRPELVLVIGQMNWNNISTLYVPAGEMLKHAPERRYAEVCRYPIGEGRTALAFHVKHTAAGFNFKKFVPLFRSVDKLVRSGSTN